MPAALLCPDTTAAREFGPESSPTELRFRMAADLEVLAEQTGDPRFRRAAGVLRGALGGRPWVAPERLAEVRDILATDPTATVRGACHLVARTMALAPHEIERHATRLRSQYYRKRRIWREHQM